MQFARRLLGLGLVALLMAVGAQAQTLRSTDDPRNQAPTVNGGTGLFTVYDAQTLRKGEFNFGFYANHFHRDPGNLRFEVYPINFQIGLSDRIELFVNYEVNRQVVTGTPALLSGFYLPDVRTQTLPAGRLVILPGTNRIGMVPGNPCGNGGFPGPCVIPGVAGSGPFSARPSPNGTAVYPGLGAPVGGILPALAPNTSPNYNPAAPFLARFADSGMGDVWLGGKIRLTDPKSAFGLALVPLIKIPTVTDLFPGLERGRSTGAIDYGMLAAIDGRVSKHINISANLGFIRKGDPRADSMNLGPLCVGCSVIPGFGTSNRALDLPNEIRAGLGFDFPVSQYLQFIAEINSISYVGSRTPTLLRNNPVDFIGGARIFPTRWLSISAAYQRHLNNFSEVNRRFTPNGFLAGVSFGRTNARQSPALPNKPPTVVLSVGAVTKGSLDVVRESASTICPGDKVALTAAATDPDGDSLVYRWTTTGGKVVGEGANASFDASGLAPGEYTVTVEVDDGCGGAAYDTKTLRVTACPPQTVCFDANLKASADKATADAGEKITISTAGVTGGRNYGAVTYQWATSAGRITGSGTRVTLDTTGVTPGSTIEITAKAISETGNCSASGAVRVTLRTPPPPKPRPRASEIGQCTTFKRGSARVDNACKDILRTRVIPAMQADPGAKLLIDSYRGAKERSTKLDTQRGKNVRDLLANPKSDLGTAIDANRMSVRPGGVTASGDQVRIWLVPTGADDPSGPAVVDVGPVPTPRRGARR